MQAGRSTRPWLWAADLCPSPCPRASYPHVALRMVLLRIRSCFSMLGAVQLLHGGAWGYLLLTAEWLGQLTCPCSCVAISHLLGACWSIALLGMGPVLQPWCVWFFWWALVASLVLQPLSLQAFPCSVLNLKCMSVVRLAYVNPCGPCSERLQFLLKHDCPQFAVAWSKGTLLRSKHWELKQNNSLHGCR